jgi:hypothetical protein
MAIMVLCVALTGAAYIADPNRPLTSFYEGMSCEEATELYDEAALLFRIAGSRLESVKTGKSKFFWIQMRQFMMSLHDPLLVRQGQVCKKA